MKGMRGVSYAFHGEKENWGGGVGEAHNEVCDGGYMIELVSRRHPRASSSQWYRFQLHPSLC